MPVNDNKVVDGMIGELGNNGELQSTAPGGRRSLLNTVNLATKVRSLKCFIAGCDASTSSYTRFYCRTAL